MKAGIGKLFLSILIIVSCAILLIHAKSNITPASVHVSGYTRKDGTQVKAYNRRPPGSVAHDAPYETLSGFSLIGIGIGVIIAYFSITEIKETHTDRTSKPIHESKDHVEIRVPELIIKYYDAEGRITDRKIDIISIKKEYNDFYIRAYCYLRNEERTFKFSRIVQLTVDGVLRDKKYLFVCYKYKRNTSDTIAP